MLRIYVGFFVLSLLISGALNQSKNNNKTNATSDKPLSDFLNRFHQNDYHFSFEWAEMVRFNKRYLKDNQIHTFKYNRTCTAINATYISNTGLGNDLELMVQTYKFLSNEYRLFPMRFQFNYCAGITKNIAGLRKFDKCGNFSCPVLKGNRYEICNWTLDDSMFPPLIPSGKYTIDVQGSFHSEDVFLQRFYRTISQSVV